MDAKQECLLRTRIPSEEVLSPNIKDTRYTCQQQRLAASRKEPLAANQCKPKRHTVTGLSDSPDAHKIQSDAKMILWFHELPKYLA